MKVQLPFFTIILFISSKPILSSIEDNEVSDASEISKTYELPDDVKREIAGYAPIVNKIINAVTKGKFKHSTYDRLAEFIDTFGNRIAGSENLENAIDYMLNKSRENGLENVHGEEVKVPHWIRGNESAYLMHPRFQRLAVLGLGSSVGTPPEGITAEAFVVNSFDELEDNSSKVKGKIVVFNEEYQSYGQAVEYRDYAADRPFSLYNPHTGWQDYSGEVPKIPTAAITLEDARMLRRMQDRGQKLIVNLKMEAKTLEDAVSRNTVVEIKGSSNPEKVVIFSGHLDSWDVGQGAMDDGAGAFMSWNSLVLLKALGLRPRRTLRAVLWTGEEEGLVGAFAYLKEHQSELGDLDFIMESDEGTFNPLGIEYAGPEIGFSVIQEILKLLAPINTTQAKWSRNVGSDITIWIAKGIPGASLLNENKRYFWYHHSDADTMDAEDPDVLDKCTALWASVAYILADMNYTIPKNLSLFN